jgi:hypothetical protein
MAKIQGSDGQMDKRKIAILNIDSILKCLILQAKLGLYVKTCRKIAVGPKV